ncbi:amino acid permease, partial [Acinetobacter baumannii]
FIAILSIKVTTWFTTEFKSNLQYGVPLVLVLIFFYYLKRSTVKLNLNSSEETLK